ncbi:hypothetical protein LABALGNA3A7_09710 [Dellaglioa algida]|nr:hypothetical protein LABALGNA3A7_09710 [Dellaglioa algida]
MKNNISKLRFNNEGNSVVINIYGVIDGSEISAKNIREILDTANPESITVRINSVGGDVQEGIAIGNVIKSYGVPTVAYVDSLCASIATVIAVSCDKTIMAANATFMIHNPSGSMEAGTTMTAVELTSLAAALESMAHSIKQSYLDKGVKIAESKLDELMAAETWLTAQEALDMGFIDEIGEPVKAVACATRAMLNMYENAPDDLPTQEDPDEPASPSKPKEGENAMDDLMKQMFDTVDEIKKQYKPGTEPDKPADPNAPADPSKPNQDPNQKSTPIENMFKAFFNTTK